MNFVKNITASLIILLSVPTTSLFNSQPSSQPILFSVSISLPQAQILTSKTNQRYVQMEGGYTLQNEAGFKLPIQVVFVNFPANKKILGYSVTNRQKKELLNVRLPKFTSAQSISFIPSALAEYSTGNHLCSLAFIQKGEKESTAVFILKPCLYSPSEQMLSITGSFQICLKLSDRDNVAQAVEVPVLDKYHHCIIAKIAKIPLLLEYKNFLEERGVSTYIFPYEFASSYSGSNEQEKLRDALNSLYMKHGIESALIVGYSAVIPMMKLALYGRDSKYNEVVPSDMFYSDLSSDWDSNHNGYYGEYELDFPDFTNEINIGRLPYNTDNEISSYLQRLMNFFEENKDKRKKILTAGGWYRFKEEDYATKDDEMYDIDGGYVAYTDSRNYFSDYQHRGLYEHEGIKISKVVNQGEDLSYKSFITAMNELNPLLVLLNGNGNRFEINKKVWVEDKNNNKMVDYLELAEPSFIDMYTPGHITSRSQSVIFCDVQSTMNPDVDYNLGTEFLKKNAVGFLGFTQPCYYFINDNPNPLNYELSFSSFGLFANTEYFFSQELNLGESMKKGIKDYWEVCKKDPKRENLPRQILNIYAYSLYGDPLMTFSILEKKSGLNYISQGSLQKGSKAYNIKEVSIGKDNDFTALKCQVYETLKNKDYQFSLFVDSDNNPNTGGTDTNGANFWFIYGFDSNQKFNFKCLQWNSSVYDWVNYSADPVYNRFGFDFTHSSIWIKIPTTAFLGNTFRYKIELKSQITQELSLFPENGNYSVYPTKLILPPSQPKIESLNIMDRNIRIVISTLQPRTYPVKGYELYRKVNTKSFQIIKSGDITELVIIDQDYIPDVTLTYKVRAFDNQNPPNYSFYSEESSIIIPKDPDSPNPKPPIQPPQSVQLTGSYNEANKHILLKWSTPVPGTFPIKSIEIYRGLKASTISFYQTISGLDDQFKDYLIESDKTYYYYIFVVDNQIPKNKSNPSNTVIIQTQITKPPSNPTITIQLIVGEKYAYVNNNFMLLDIAPLMKSDRVFVPLRFIAEAFGAKVKWTEDVSNNGEGSIQIQYNAKDGTLLIIQMHTLEKLVYVDIEKNGQFLERKTITLDAAPFIVKPANRTVVPIRFIAETFGASVLWDESTQSVIITL